MSFVTIKSYYLESIEYELFECHAFGIEMWLLFTNLLFETLEDLGLSNGIALYSFTEVGLIFEQGLRNLSFNVIAPFMSLMVDAQRSSFID
jgi:hypothetical protein